MDYARELTPCMHSRDRQTMQQMLMDNDTAQRQDKYLSAFMISVSQQCYC